MLGKSYKMGRTIGRAGMNHDIRMSNRAEAGLGMASMIGFVLVIAVVLILIGVI